MKRYLKKLYSTITKAEMGILPASLTFYLVLAIIPVLTLTVLIASYFSISLDSVIQLINNILPKQIATYIAEAISGEGFDKSIGFFNIVSFMVAINGTYAIIKVSNTLYKVKKREVGKDIIKAIILLINILLLFIFLLIVPLFGEKILLLLKSNAILNGLTNEFIIFFKIIKWPVTFLMIYFNIKLMYTIAPSKSIKSRETSLGAFLTTILWMIFTSVFGYYITYFARYDIVYGNLSSIIILMIWLYSLSYVFILGIAINTTKYHNNLEDDNNNK